MIFLYIDTKIKDLATYSPRAVLLAMICLMHINLYAKQKLDVSSPDGKIIFSVVQKDNSIYYKVSFNKMPVIEESVLGLEFKTFKFLDNISVSKSEKGSGIETYKLITGKSSQVNDAFNRLSITVKQTKAPFHQLTIHIKAFNHAVAFRYEMPQWQGVKEYQLIREYSTFKFSDDVKIRALFFPNYTSSHEGVYQYTSVSRIPRDTLVDLPALFECGNGIYASVTEAALVNYAGMYLSKTDAGMVCKLSPNPKDTSVKVAATLPHRSPWRVIMLSDKINDLIETNVLTSLNEPAKIANTDWVQPGKTTFPWWNGNVVPDTINAPGNNFVTNKYYIDFCARNNLEYHSVVEYGLHQWYTDDGVGFQPGPNNDVTKPVPGLDMKEICDYARTKNVKIRVWVHWAALYPRLDSAFAIFEKWGLTGMMVDFMDRDDQQMVNIQNEMLEKAAKHHLHIQFHGAYKPTGLNRTWPNEFTREGTLNYENNKWGYYIQPAWDLDIAFTRGLAGSTDYHLGGFRAVPQSKIKANYTRPLMLGTRCHMLGMYVVLESALGMVCDYPAAYEGQPGFEFIKEVPTSWDETKVVAAKVGEYLITARRKGTVWWVGGINNNTERTLELDFGFLQSTEATARVYADGDDVVTDPNSIKISDAIVSGHKKVKIKMAAGGGLAMKIAL